MLDTFLISRNWLLPAELLERVKSLRDELAPLHNFLNELEPATELDERQKVWVQEIRDIFQFLEETFSPFLHSAEEDTRRFECFAPLKNALTVWGSQSKLQKKLHKIEKRILVASSRYYAYAIGEFMVRNGSRSIIPQVRMQGVASGSKSTYGGPFSRLTIPIIGRATKELVDQLFSQLWQPSMLDLKLMQALFKDATQMGDSDRRVNVWLQQMKEIFSRLKALDKDLKETSERKKGIDRLRSLNKISHEAKQIENDIDDISARMMRYDIIGSVIAAYGKQEVPALTEIGFPLSILSGESKAQARVKKEVQIINALVEDLRTMEKLDARVKVWAKELAGVAREVNAIAEQEFNGIHGRFKFAQRMHRLSKWIDQIMEWKSTYDIRGIRARNGSSVIIHKLEAAEPYPSGIVAKEVESIRREIKLMKALDADIQEISGIDEKLEIWMQEMHDVAKDAENLVQNLHNIWHGDMPQIWKLVILYKDFSFEYKVLKSIRHIKDKIKNLRERRIRYGIEEINRIPSVVDGEISSWLVLHNKHLCVLPILGLKRTGKASISELIYNNNVILKHFDCCVWVTIPEDFNALRVLEDIVEQVKEQEGKKRKRTANEPLVANSRAPETEICTEEEEMMEKLAKMLIQRRYLIVLDGFLSAEVCLDLQKSFPNASNGSRIILATQSMDEEEWLQLWQKLTSEMNSGQSRKLTRQGEFQILDPVKIRDLPREKETVSDRERVMMQLQKDKTTRLESSTNILENAPQNLWRCLYYFSLFPADMEIPARRLIALWVAEGLARPKSGKTAENTGESYVLELIERDMIKATKMKLNGKVKACKLCDGYLETLSKKTKEANFFKDEADKTFRLVVDHTNRSDSCGHIDGSKPCSSSLLKARYREVNCFFLFDTEEGGKHGDNIGNFLARCISKRCFLLLRVLDLERVFRPKLPTVLGQLTGMRYLGLRWTYLESLPPEVSKLLNLQVLDVKRTYISSLPKSIWSMQYLRHLYLSETYRTRFDSPPNNPSLTELQTLWGAFIDEDSPVSIPRGHLADG